ncbi:hypothetical protein D3C75_1343540 [compost metagenome]
MGTVPVFAHSACLQGNIQPQPFQRSRVDHARLCTEQTRMHFRRVFEAMRHCVVALGMEPVHHLIEGQVQSVAQTA